METAVRRGPGIQRGRPLTLALAGLATLVACSGNPAPAPPADAATPTATSTPSPSGFSSPTVAAPPAMPAAARGTSVKAAKAFVRYYVATINYAAATGDAEQLRGLGTRRCISCRAIIADVHRIYSAGGFIRSKGWLLTALAAVPGQPRQAPIFQLGILESPQIVRATATSGTKHYKGGKQPMTMYLILRKTVWRVARLDLVR